MNNVKLSHLLTGAMLAVGLIPLVIAAFIATNSAGNSLQAQGFAQLESIRDVKKAAIERHFEESHNIIKITAASPTVVQASARLKASFNAYLQQTRPNVELQRTELARYYQEDFAERYQEINNTALDTAPLYQEISATAVALQHAYIFENPAALGNKDQMIRAPGTARYHQDHSQYHEYFRQILQDFGYYDIFLADPETGAIFYSVFKELDYATSLLTGPYRNTNFADAFKTVVKEQAIYTEDFKQYQPSYEAPASFQAAPVFSGGQLEAVLVFQLPIEPINAIMATRSGMGETGETYLVGPDKLMRSDSYLQPGTHSVTASFADPAIGKVDTVAVQRALSGQAWTEIITDYLGNEVLSSYAPIDLGDFTWVILSEKDTAEAFAPVSALTKLVLVVILVAIVVIVFISLRLASGIAGPINSIAGIMSQVQATGDFSLRINTTARNELGTISNAFDNLLGNLMQVFQASSKALETVSSGDYSARVEGQYQGSLQTLQQGIDATIADIQKASDESDRQRAAANLQAQEAAKQKELAQKQQALASQQADEAAKQKELAMHARAQAEEKAKEAQAASEDAGKQRELAQSKAEEAQQIAQQAQQDAIAANRIKQALDNVSTYAVVCDVQQQIIFCNKAMLTLLADSESNFSRHGVNLNARNCIGSNINVLLRDGDILAAISDTGAKPHSFQYKIGDATFAIATNTILDDKLNKLGTVIELRDRTEEVAAESEIDEIVTAASAGDLSIRVSESGKNGFFYSLAIGLNKLMGSSEQILSEMGNVMAAMAQGDLSNRVTGDYSGMFAKLKEDANSTIAELTRVIQEINGSSDLISSNAVSIAAGNTQMSDRTQNQASALEQTSASMEELTSSVKLTAENAAQARQVAENAQHLATEGGTVCEQAIESMSAIGASSKKINDIIGVIDEIAFQTNLLALNASVEAARAGEQGRGFAVVASEVRNLAQRSATAAKEIKELITESVDKVQMGSVLVNQSGNSLQQIINAVAKVSEGINSIASATEEQSSGIEQVNRAITEMDESTQQSSAFVEETSSAANNMADEAEEMRHKLAFFTVQ